MRNTNGETVFNARFGVAATCLMAACLVAFPAGCTKSGGGNVGYNPPPPKTTAQIHQEIDANTKLTPAMKQMLKEQVATGVSSGGMAQPGGKPGAVPADVAGYLKSSGASKNNNP